MTDTVLAANTSPEALLKQAVMGAEATARKAAAPAAIAAKTADYRRAPRVTGLVGGALVFGAVLGAGATYLITAQNDGMPDGFAQLRSHLDATRLEIGRNHAEVERIGKSLSQLQEIAEAGRNEGKTRSTALVERITRSEQTLTGRIAALSEKLDQAEKEQTARFAGLDAQRLAPQALVSITSQAARTTTPEPTATGTLADKPKPIPTEKPISTENWALREVYDGVAILEDRKRRVVEVGPGDTVPGVGRIDAIERRGKAWVVVTRQGVITHQTW